MEEEGEEACHEGVEDIERGESGDGWGVDC